MSMETPFLFVCGPVSDRIGFEHAVIRGAGDEEHLARSFRRIIQAVDTERPEVGERIHRLVRRDGWSVYAELRGIRPHDSGNNRNAYIGVGFVYRQGPEWDGPQAERWVDAVAREHEKLRRWQEQTSGRLAADFRIPRYRDIRESAPGEPGPRGPPHKALSDDERVALIHLVRHSREGQRLETDSLMEAARRCPERKEGGKRPVEQARRMGTGMGRQVRPHRRATAGAGRGVLDQTNRNYNIERCMWHIVSALGGALVMMGVLMWTGEWTGTATNAGATETAECGPDRTDQE